MTGSRSLASYVLTRVITVLTTIVVVSSSWAGAQSTSGQITGIGNTTSTPVPGVPHDYITGLSEIVNPANGALSIRIKAPTPHERGVNWPTYAYTYDSDGQFTLAPQWLTSTGGSQEYTAVDYLDFQSAIPSEVSGQTTIASVTLPSGNGVSTTYQCQITSGFVYTDPDGGKHGLGLGVSTPIAGGSNACSNFPAAFNQTIGGDAQYKAFITNTSSSPVAVTIIDTHGDAVVPSSSSGFVTEDVNGNTQTGSTTSTNNTSTSTLRTSTGRAQTTYATSSEYTLTVPDVTTPSGQAAPYVATYSTIAAPTEALHVTTVNEGSGGYGCQIGSTITNQATTSEQVTSLALPNGESYKFQYDPVYGLVNKITYPTGAWVEYTWSVISNAEGDQYRTTAPELGGLCALTHDWFAITKRVVSYDGSSAGDEEQDFSYSTTWPATGEANSYQWISKSTTVTTIDLTKTSKPQFKTVYTYSPMLPPPESISAWEDLGYVPQENTIQYYDTNGSLLKTVTKAWQSMSLMSGECDTLPSGSISGRFYTYQQYSGFGSQGSGVLNGEALWTDLPTDVAEYDYGQVTTPCVRPSSSVIPVRETKTTYASFGNTPLFQYASLLDRPSKVQVYGNVSGTQTLESETDYAYDGTALSSVSGNVYNHDSAYGTGNTVRGNPTQVTRTCTTSIASCSYATSVTKYTYDIAGQVVQSQDANSNTTTYTYSDSAIAGNGTPPSGYVTDAFLSTITEPPLPAGTFTQTFTWGYNDGRLRSKTDENGETSNFYYTTGGKSGSSYDPFFRLTEADYPDTGYEKATYNDSTPSVTVTTAINTGSSPVTETKETIYQAMGQNPIETQLQSDPVHTRYVDTTYDGLNRVSTVSNPYWTSSDTTYGLTSYTYDALNRALSVTHPDNTAQTSTYTNNTVLFTDEDGNEWQRTSDALGRLTQVLEPNGTSKTPTMETDYTYDALGNLTNVKQWGGPNGTAGSRTRTFVYTGLSELQSSTNPENGTLTYTYDANGNVKTRTDGRSVVTTYGPYDSHNRPAGKSYSDGITPPVSYTYDTSSISGNQYTKTRLTSATVMNGSNILSQVSPYNYDPMGRVQDIQSCLPTSTTACSSTTLFYTYDVGGNVSSLTNAVFNNPGITTTSIAVNYGYDGANQLSSVTSSWNTNNDTLLPLTLFQANSTNQSSPGYGPMGLMNADLGIPSGSSTAVVSIGRNYDNRSRILSETDTANDTQTSPATSSTGTITISGSEQSNAIPAKPGTGSVTISGSEQETTIRVVCGPGPTYCNEPEYDSGGITITINGTAYTMAYNNSTTSSADAASILASGINQGSLATATVTGSVVYITAKTGGTSSDYSLSASSSTSQGQYFSSPSFTATASGPTLTGGANGSTTYDSGTVTATVDSCSDSYSYGQSSTSTSVASGLASSLSSSCSSIVSATASGSTISLASKATGASTDWPITTSVSYNSSQFSSASFAETPSGMSGGENAGYGQAVVYSYNIPPYNASNPSAGGYDAVGNVISFSDAVMGTWNYKYDTLNRVSSASAIAGSYSSAAMSWTIDPFGDRTAQTASGTPQNPVPQSWSATMSTGNNNRIATSNAGTWSYDAAGDVLLDGVNNYLYDGEGRICAVEENYSPFAKYGYLYDGNGDRIAKGTLTSFSCNLSTNGFTLNSAQLRGADGEQISEFGPSSGSGLEWLHTNVFADGKLLMTYGGAVAYFALSDWLGTKRAEIAGNCTPSTYASFAYGDGLTTTSGNCPDATEHHYTQKEHDFETLNDYFGARYYASMTGRFISPDPTGGHQENPQTFNKYSYVSNSPLNSTDPTGLDSYLACGEGDNCGMRIVGFNSTDGSVQWANVQLESGSSRAIEIGSDGQGGLIDVNTGQAYTGSVNGSGVFFSNDGGKTSSMGIFDNLSPKKENIFQDAGWANGGTLKGFNWTLDHSKLEAGQKEAGSFTFLGDLSQAANAILAAKFQYWLFGQDIGSFEFRSPGDKGTGANSGHIILNRGDLSPADGVPEVGGSMHFGEHNPMRGARAHVHEAAQ